MKLKYIKKLVGKYCKIVIKEPGKQRANVITGIIEDIDTDEGFVIIDSNQGLEHIDINSMVAIKPSY